MNWPANEPQSKKDIRMNTNRIVTAAVLASASGLAMNAGPTREIIAWETVAFTVPEKAPKFRQH
jgi:hypothetical protein